MFYTKIAAVLLAAVMASSGRKLPIYSVETPEKLCAITFDAAWAAADTEPILKILEDNGVKASFFLCGIWVNKNPELLLRIRDEGHDICNHGDTHAHCSSLTLSQNKKEITGAHEKVQNAAGVTMNLYRPPYGEYNNTVLDAAKELGYYVVQWDVDSWDWMNRGNSDIKDRVLNNKNLRNGSIILFHTDAKDTVNVLDDIIKGLKAKGFSIVPVSQLIYRENYHIDHEGRQFMN